MPARWIVSIRKKTPKNSPPKICSTSIRWSASIAALAFRFVPCSAIFALDDLPEKWSDYAQKNAAYFGR